MTLGEKIRDLRQEHGESQMALAVALGYRDYHMIIKIEKDKIPLSDITLDRIAEHYNKPKGYFGKENKTAERLRLRKRVNEYCVERLQNNQPCRECSAWGSALCESENFFRRDLKVIRAAVERLCG